jgi:hypothetical protein
MTTNDDATVYVLAREGGMYLMDFADNANPAGPGYPWTDNPNLAWQFPDRQRRSTGRGA